MSAETILTLEGISKEFRFRRGAFAKHTSSVLAVDNVSLELQRGEVLGLAGESGSGKSTLALMIVGLLEPTAGRIIFEGADLRSLPRDERRRFRRRVQIVFQDPYSSFDPRMRIGAIVAEALQTDARRNVRLRRERVKELLDMVGLDPDAAARFPHEFSGGQRQRIGIARALAAEPDLLVLDEPVSALDVSVQAQVLNLLGDLRERLGLTYLLISHDLDVVYYLCDRVAVMYLGRVVEIGTAREIMFAPEHPYSRLLVESSPRVGQTEGEVSGRDPDAAAEEIDRSGCVFAPRCGRRIERCLDERPELTPLSTDAALACWNPLGQRGARMTGLTIAGVPRTREDASAEKSSEGDRGG